MVEYGHKKLTKHFCGSFLFIEETTSAICTKILCFFSTFRCLELTPYKYPWKQWTRPYYAKSNSLSLCTTPKAASTFWKTFFRQQRLLDRGQSKSSTKAVVGPLDCCIKLCSLNHFIIVYGQATLSCKCKAGVFHKKVHFGMGHCCSNYRFYSFTAAYNISINYFFRCSRQVI